MSSCRATNAKVRTALVIGYVYLIPVAYFAGTIQWLRDNL